MGLHVNGIEPNGVQPNGIEPNGIEPNGIEPNGIKPNGIEPNGASVAGLTPPRLLALTLSGVRLRAGSEGLRIDAIEVNGLRLSAATGLVLESVEVEAPRSERAAPAPAPDFGAVTVASVELPDGRSFNT